MVVYRPQNRNRATSSCSCNTQNSTSQTSEQQVQQNQMVEQCDRHGHHHCPCEPTITITTDEPPVLETDIIYGPPGKDGTINGYNEVSIIGGNNIEVATSENKITINSITYEDNVDSKVCPCPCSCHEQVKLSSKWCIKHNLNKYPSVTVVDCCNREIICEVKYISKNELHLLFNGKFKGKAYLN